MCSGKGELGKTLFVTKIRASLVAQMVKNLPATRRPGFNPWVGKIPGGGDSYLLQVFLPGELYGQRRVAGYSPWGLKELDMTERLHTTTFCTLFLTTESTPFLLRDSCPQ